MERGKGEVEASQTPDDSLSKEWRQSRGWPLALSRLGGILVIYPHRRKLHRRRRQKGQIVPCMTPLEEIALGRAGLSDRVLGAMASLRGGDPWLGLRDFCG